MLSQSIQLLLDGYRAYFAKKAPEEAELTIHVDEIASKIARFYERARNVIDYREEHLLRKNFIFRALQRIVLTHENKADVAELLTKEIIRAGHLPNDTIPKNKIAEVRYLINNLLFLLAHTRGTPKEKIALTQWLFTLTASAIEENLAPPLRGRFIAEAMFMALKDSLVIKGAAVEEADKFVQLFIGIERALLRVDEDQLSYRLLKFMYPSWDTPAPEELEAVASRLPEIKKEMEAHARHPLGPLFFKLCNRYNTIFLLLGDAVFDEKNFSQDPEEVFANEMNLERVIRDAYRRRYTRQKAHLKRLAFFTIISLFITKVLIALAVEVPLDLFFAHGYSTANIAANIAFPPLLMAIIISLIRLPSDENLEIVLKETQAVVYADRQKEYLVVVPEEKNKRIAKLAIFIYWAVSLAVLWGSVRVLLLFNFSVASIVVFVLFTSIVAATGVRVYNRSKELSLEEERPSLKTFFADLLFMPFVSIGKLAIAGLGKFRFLVLAVNLIDVPFQGFLIFLESFNAFIRSKKEELN